MPVYRYNLGPLDNNTYLVVDESSLHAALVDPTFDSRGIWDKIAAAGIHLDYVLNTHAHIDHVVENAYFVRQSDAPLALHPLDQPLYDAMESQAIWLGMDQPEVVTPGLLLAHGDSITLGATALKVVHTPGHSPGHVCFVGPDFVVAGDVLFRGSIGRTDLPGGNYSELIASIQRELLVLPDETVVYPGHGETTTIGIERLSNPFLIDLIEAN